MNKSMYCLSLLLLLAACGGASGLAAAPAVPPPAPASLPEEASLLSHPEQEALAEVEEQGDGRSAAFAVAGYGEPGAQPADGDAAPQAQALAAAAAHKLYVAPGGSDSNPGTASLPFRSLWRAAKAAGPGSKVFVAPGT